MSWEEKHSQARPLPRAAEAAAAAARGLHDGRYAEQDEQVQRSLIGGSGGDTTRLHQRDRATTAAPNTTGTPTNLPRDGDEDHRTAFAGSTASHRRRQARSTPRQQQQQQQQQAQLDHASSPSPASSSHITPLLLQTASEARWRRRRNNLSNSNSQVEELRQRSNSELVLKVAVMEEVHGVDVSWLHHTNKDHHKHKHTQSSPDVRRDVKPPPATNNTTTTTTTTQPPSGVSRKILQQTPSNLSTTQQSPPPPTVTPATPVEPTKDSTNAFPTAPTTPSPSSNTNKPLPKRPGLLRGASSERPSAQDASGGKPGSKRSSWMNSLSSKFSSSSSAPGTPNEQRPGPIPQQQQQQNLSRQVSNQSSLLQTPSPGSAAGSEAVTEEAEPYLPAKPKESSSSFFSSITRRLSAASQTGGIPKAAGAGSVCPRRVLNVDPNRERCAVPEMDPSRLRRVSFCVDVEIAGGPRYRDDDEDEEGKERKKKEFKMRERAEGEALKRPEVLVEEKDEEEDNKARAIPGKEQGVKGLDGTGEKPMTEEERDSAAKKREKKQKSEAERRERKEKRRKRAEENGQVPVEVMLDGEGGDAAASQQPPNGSSNTSLPQTLQQQPTPTGRQDRPTTDPARIYRRCCQLRESPILKRITEQLSRPTCTLPQEPGIVQCLDLTGSRLQLADVISLGDWLAVVPVKHLKLEDADLNDEGVRCVLAGLLAAKKPEPTKRKSPTPRHREGIPTKPHQERAGVVEKITLKNNPRLTRVGWKHINLFLYMCRSIRTLDLSMNQFPATLPPSAPNTPLKSPPAATVSTPGPTPDLDAADALYRCLADRLAGPKKLEELIMSECGLSTAQVQRVVDGAIAAGVSRLGLAGNHLDDEGLEPVLLYLRSGICQALDIGGNDLRGKLDRVADAIATPSNGGERPSCWGLSLAGCNLDSASLKPLFATLVKLPNFRFLDLSHNRDLGADNGLITLLRRYISQLRDLKRIHLADVNMSPKQAIALADVLPEGPRLAHLNLLQNPALSALAEAKTEAEREEACALYASLMASVRVSQTIICLDVDVPAPDNSEVVKALAKQIVAYSLRNMELFAIAEATGNAQQPPPSTTAATSALTSPHGGERAVKEISVPDVLLHLVGHVEGNSEDHDNDPPAPDDDYIIGGTGVVKALQYVLGEKESEARRTSMPSGSGAATPSRDARPGSSAGMVDSKRAKKMSTNLLGSARKIRERLQPALAKEAATGGDDLAYRRLLFLDQTLESMITRFEEEYPETRIGPPPTTAKDPRDAQASSSTSDKNVLASSINTQTSFTNASDDEDADDAALRPPPARHNSSSDTTLAARALSIEEGRLHRMGQALRREVIDSPRSATSTTFPSPDGGGSSSALAGAESTWAPWRNEAQSHAESERLRTLGEKVEGISGVELKGIVDEEGWEGLLRKVGGTYEDLRTLQEQDPEGWRAFRDAQEKARLNNAAGGVGRGGG